MSAPYSRREAAAVLVTVLAVTVSLSLVITPLSQVADPVRKSFDIDDVQFSYLLGALFAIPSMIMTVAGGWLADHVTRRKLLGAAMVLWTAGAIWSALASSYIELASARLIVAASAGIKFPLVMSWLSDAYPPERRGRAIGAVFVFIGTGPAIGGALGGMVLHAAQQGAFVGLPIVGTLEAWRVALILLALLNVPVLPLVLSLPDRRVAVADAGEREGGHAQRHSLLLIGAVVLATALLTLADNANLSWLPTVLSRQHGFDAQQVGFVFGLVVTCAGVIGPLIGGGLDGWIYRRAGNAGRMATCAVATFVCAPLLAMFITQAAQFYIGALIVNGILTMLTMTISFVALQSLLPSNKQGVGIGLAQASNNLAAASAPTVVAFVSQAGQSTSLVYGVAAVTLTAFVGATAFCAISAWSLGRRNSHHSRLAALSTEPS